MRSVLAAQHAVGWGRALAWGWCSVVALALIACSGRNAAAELPASVQLTEGVPFCTGQLPQGAQVLKLDIAQPRGLTRPAPVVMLVHGGGWSAGSRQDYRPLMLALAQQDMVAVSIDYRLAPQSRFPAQLEDVKCAVRWIREHAALYQMDTRRVVAVGGSAGAHLVALLGTTAHLPRFEGRGGFSAQSSHIDAMVLHGGPYDLTVGVREALAAPTSESVHALNMIESLLGASLAQRPQAYSEASAASYVSSRSASAMIIHGRLDPLVPPRQATRFHEVLTAHGVPSELIVIDRAGHGDFGPKPEAVTRRFLGFMKGAAPTGTPRAGSGGGG
ncbi:MAG: alpha/beta hydrolase [Rhodoferax sp.]|nr:alpha/beta hydrolase [Rhodoferax sp.]